MAASKTTVASAPSFRVNADGLNLRSAPRVTSSTRLGVLHRGTRVVRVAGADGDAWWQVEAPIGTLTVRGWVASRFVEREPVVAPPPPPPPPASRMLEVHLEQNRSSVTRDSVGGAYAYPLGEPNRPTRTGDTPAERATSLRAIVRWLAVDRSRRYRKVGLTTYCNIYTSDYCYLAGVYLPRVWWTERSLEKLARREHTNPVLGVTVQEMTANQLFGWLADRGDDFAWERVVDLDVVQARVNEGAVGIVCAQRKDINRPGHIAAVVPESTKRRAVRRSNGKVVTPLLSQAGVTNYQFGGTPPGFWTSERFRDFGFWVHE